MSLLILILLHLILFLFVAFQQHESLARITIAIEPRQLQGSQALVPVNKPQFQSLHVTSQYGRAVDVERQLASWKNMKSLKQ
uniref:Putative secreted protein n=1 Tax=Rhipicephalus microplus TaxID=6941 RepID=A0A6M2DBH8_RHIMP